MLETFNAAINDASPENSVVIITTIAVVEQQVEPDPLQEITRTKRTAASMRARRVNGTVQTRVTASTK
jgi:hypothetical protein